MKNILRFCLILLTFSLFLTSTACEIDAVFNDVEELAEGLDYEVNEDGETAFEDYNKLSAIMHSENATV